jgi:hypothetical protein
MDRLVEEGHCELIVELGGTEDGCEGGEIVVLSMFEDLLHDLRGESGFVEGIGRVDRGDGIVEGFGRLVG